MPNQVDIDYTPCIVEFHCKTDLFYEKVTNLVHKVDSRSENEVDEACQHLKQFSSIGVAFFPPNASRRLPLDFIAFSSCEANILFPVTEDVMKKLKPIFEDLDIEKVVYGGMRISDCLKHVYKIILEAVHDVRVLDHQLMSNYKSNFRKKVRPRSWHECVEHYFNVQLPWEENRDFYQKSGKGLLIRSKLDESGESYVRSRVMFLREMKRHQKIEIFAPFFQNQRSSITVMRDCSEQEWADIDMTESEWGTLWMGYDETDRSGLEHIPDVMLPYTNSKFAKQRSLRPVTIRHQGTQTEGTQYEDVSSEDKTTHKNENVERIHPVSFVQKLRQNVDMDGLAKPFNQVHHKMETSRFLASESSKGESQRSPGKNGEPSSHQPAYGRNSGLEFSHQDYARIVEKYEAKLKQENESAQQVPFLRQLHVNRAGCSDNQAQRISDESSSSDESDERGKFVHFNRQLPNVEWPESTNERPPLKAIYIPAGHETVQSN